MCSSPTEQCLSCSKCSVCIHGPESHPTIYRINSILITLAFKTLHNHVPYSAFSIHGKFILKKLYTMMIFCDSKLTTVQCLVVSLRNQRWIFPIRQTRDYDVENQNASYYFTVRNACCRDTWNVFQYLKRLWSVIVSLQANLKGVLSSNQKNA